MRTFIYGLEDVDRGADALKQAQRLGYTPGDRETAQLADGYRARGETLARTARDARRHGAGAGIPDARAEAYRQALELYSKCRRVRRRVAAACATAQRALASTEQRLASDRTRSAAAPPEPSPAPSRPMGVTYTPAAERDPAASAAGRSRLGDAGCAAGRRVARLAARHRAGLCRPAPRARRVGARRARGADRQPEHRRRSETLEPALARSSRTRRSAVRGARAVSVPDGGERRALPNVGARTRAERRARSPGCDAQANAERARGLRRRARSVLTTGAIWRR